MVAIKCTEVRIVFTEKQIIFDWVSSNRNAQVSGTAVAKSVVSRNKQRRRD